MCVRTDGGGAPGPSGAKEFHCRPRTEVHTVGPMADDEPTRAARLLDAQAKAARLFAEIEARGLVAPGQGERAVSDSIRDLANDLFGTTRHWHKRIVRCGPNTLRPYRENPPDRVIGADD